MSLLTDTKELLDSFKNEDVKILHLIDRIGYDNVINDIKDLDLIHKIKENLPLNLYNLIEEDNIEIVSHLAHLKNPFIKENIYKNYFRKSLANDHPVASIENIITKNIITGEKEVVSGFFKNPFTGMLIEIKESEVGNFARINRVSDRNASELINSVNIDTTEIVIPFNKDKENDFNLEFIINHELAHITGVQILNPSEGILKNISILKESHSDVLSLFKIIKDHDLTELDSISLIDELIVERSNIRRLDIELFTVDNYINEHLTQPALFLLKGFIKEDLNYIKDMKIEDMNNLAIILSEEACKEENFLNISKQEKITPQDPNALLGDFNQIKNMPNNNILTKIVLKAEQLSGSDDIAGLIVNKLTTTPAARLDYELRLLCSMDKNDLLKIDFPNNHNVVKYIKNEFKINKIESEHNNLELSEFFDYSEVLKKTEGLKIKSF